MSGLKRFIPLLDRVLVERVAGDANAKTSGGIFLPQTKTSGNNFAKVIAVGTGSHKSDGSFIPLLVKEGDTIIISPKAKPITIPSNEKTFELINEYDVLGVVEN